MKNTRPFFGKKNNKVEVKSKKNTKYNKVFYEINTFICNMVIHDVKLYITFILIYYVE